VQKCSETHLASGVKIAYYHNLFSEDFMDKKRTHIISEGYSMNYLIPSVILFLVSVFIYIVNIPLGVCLSLAAISLLLIKTGVEVDLNNYRLRSFKEFLSIRRGVWFSLKDSKECLIDYNREAAIMSSRGSSNLVRSETFDLNIIFKSNSKKMIHEFTNYKLARQTSQLLQSEFDLNVFDQFLEIQRNIVSQRKSRRR